MFTVSNTSVLLLFYSFFRPWLMMFSSWTTGFSWPAEAMGSCWSCLYRDPIRDNHLTKFKVKTARISLYLHTVVLHAVIFNYLYSVLLKEVLMVFFLSPCRRSSMWTMRATSWALGSWSSPRPNSFFTHARETPSGGHISACDATAMTPTCFLSRAVAAVRLGRVREFYSISPPQF